MPTGFHWFQVVSEPVEGLPSVFLSDVALQTGGNWNWTLQLELVVPSRKRKCVKGLPPEETDFINLLIGPRRRAQPKLCTNQAASHQWDSFICRPLCFQ